MECRGVAIFIIEHVPVVSIRGLNDLFLYFYQSLKKTTLAVDFLGTRG